LTRLKAKLFIAVDPEAGIRRQQQQQPPSGVSVEA